jgi:hypothetical protein
MAPAFFRRILQSGPPRLHLLIDQPGQLREIRRIVAVASTVEGIVQPTVAAFAPISMSGQYRILETGYHKRSRKPHLRGGTE